jgi:DME family drug/metabolite transporter
MVKVLAVMLGITGCVFVSGAHNASAWQLNPYGIITGVLSGVAFAGYGLMGKTSSNRGIDSWTAMVYTFLVAAILLLVANLANDGLQGLLPGERLVWLGNSVFGWGVLLVLALGPTLGGFGLYSLSLTYLPASVANLIAMLEPPLTAAMAYVLLGERMTGIQLLGGCFIIACVLIVRLNESRRTFVMA